MKESKLYKLANQDWTTLAFKFPIQACGKTIHLVGVHHNSVASVIRVAELISNIKPSLVCLEVVPRQKDSGFRIIQSTLATTNSKMSNEMLEAVKQTNIVKAELEFIDEPLQNIVEDRGIVLEAKKIFNLRQRPKLPLLFNVMSFISFKRRIRNDLVKDLTSIGDMKTYCQLIRLKDDSMEKRDACMSLRIFNLMKSHETCVAVVGKSHVFGIEHYLKLLYEIKG